MNRPSIIILIMFAVTVFYHIPLTAHALYKVKQTSGQVIEVNTEVMTVLIQNGRDKILIRIVPNTIILINKRRSTIYDIQPGQYVKIKYTVINGQNEVKSIIISP